MWGSYQIINKIGQGAHGDVYLVVMEGNYYAMKKIANNKLKIQIQTDVLSRLKHPNVVHVYHVLHETNASCDLQQYCKTIYRNNNTLTHHNHPVAIPESQIVTWLCQISLALYYLHNQCHIIHRDIKLSNILIGSNGLLKLSDFGIAKKLQKHQEFANTSVGTPYYLPPQAINLGRWDHKSDVWGLGCVIYELCTGQQPFKGDSFGKLFQSIQNDRCDSIPAHYSQWLSELVQAMLEKNSTKRPSIQTILQHSEIRNKFNTLKSHYQMQYENIKYPQLTLRTTKYYESQQKLNLKSFTQQLKTAKRQKNMRITIKQENNKNDQIQLEQHNDSSSTNQYSLGRKIKVQRQKYAAKSLQSIINERKGKNQFKEFQ